MSNLTQDIKYAFRTLIRTPALTFAALLALAISIGANTAIFSIVDAVLLRPLPYRDANRLVTAWNSWPEKGFPRLPVVPSDYVEWRKQATAFEDMGASLATDVNITGAGDPERIHGARVSSNLFSVLGTQPALGRSFNGPEDQPNSRVAIISDGLWKRRFAGSAQVVGKTISIDGAPHTIVGVMPASFDYSIDFKMTGLTTPRVDVWTPLGLTPFEMNNGFVLAVVGRLKPGVTVARAEADLRAVGARITAQEPDHKGIGTSVMSLRDLLTHDVRPAVMALAVAVGLVLLIACANVANLLMTKASGRQREIAVRAALGASHKHLLRQLLTESVVLGAIAGACGLALAFGGTALLSHYAPSSILRTGAIAVDLRVLAFTLVASLLSAVLFGLAPALQAFRVNLDSVLRESARGGVGSGRQGRVRNLLVVGEIALAVLLVVGSGLLLQSFFRIVSVDPGFKPAGLTTARISLPESRYPNGTRTQQFYDGLMAELRTRPEISSVSAVTALPLDQARQVFFRIEGRPGDGDVKRAPVSASLSVDANYFRLMGIPLLRGRLLEQNDAPEREQVVVIDETLARRYWPTEDPIGKRVREGYAGNRQPWLRIVGVVGSVRQFGLGEAARPTMYRSYRQSSLGDMTVVARGRTTTDAVAKTIRAAVRKMDAEQPVAAMRTMDDVIDESVAPRRFSASLLTAFALLALLLAAVGVYAVMSYSVARRTREIGLRKALGADTRQVIGQVLEQGLALAGTGLAIGMAAAVWLTRWLTSQLYGVKATDPATFAGACVLLLLVATLACYVPARRASAVDPNVALRQE